MAERDKKGAPVRRCLNIIELLARHVADGMTNKEIADATKTTPVNVHRDTTLLESLGWVRQLDNSRWVLTTKPIALFEAYDASLKEMKARADELRENISAAAKRNRG